MATGPITMNSGRLVPVKDTQAEITATVRELITDGVALGEVMAVLRDVCFVPKKIFLIRNHVTMWEVRSMQMKNARKLFSHASLAACVEFALKYEDTP